MSLDRVSTALAALFIAAWLTQSLPMLSAPPTGAHAWRETDGLIVARNYCEEAAAFTEPRVNNRGQTDGRTGLEFPVLNYFAGKLGCASGDFVTPWRTVSLLAALMAAASLFLFARRRWDLLTASLVLAVFATSPLVPYFSRATQPDALAMALASLGLLVATTRARLAAPLLVAMAGLVKLPALVYLLPVLVLAWSDSPKSIRSRAPVAVMSLLAVVPSFFWYRHARALELLNGITNFGVTRGPAQLWREWQMREFWQWTFTQHPFDVWIFPLVTVVVLLVALVRLKRREPSLFVGVLGVTVLAYLMLCGYSAAHHDYYGLMILPLLALAGGRALAITAQWLSVRSPRLATASLVLFFSLAAIWQVRRAHNWWPHHLQEWAAFTRFSEEELRTTRVVVFSDGSPQLFWFSHQVGSGGDTEAPSLPPGELALVDRLRLRERAATIEDALRGQGCVPVFENAVVSAWRR